LGAGSARVTIEIGWASIDTSTGEIQSESHLVRPPLHWDMQPVWDPDAEKLHGISLKQLLAQGRPADDERWLRIIFDEAGPDIHDTENPCWARGAACSEARMGQRQL
jgi:hypothetical protein